MGEGESIVKQQRGLPVRFVQILTDMNASDTVLQRAASRDCGDCTYCCTWMGVEPLAKRAGTPCPHLSGLIVDFEKKEHRTRGGCAIYAQQEQPSDCRNFYCTWRLGYGRKHSRPDRARLVAQVAQTPNPDAKGLMWTRIEAYIEPDMYRAQHGQTLGAVEMVTELAQAGWVVRVFLAEGLNDPPLQLLNDDVIGVVMKRGHPEEKDAMEWCHSRGRRLILVDEIKKEKPCDGETS